MQLFKNTCFVIVVWTLLVQCTLRDTKEEPNDQIIVAGIIHDFTDESRVPEMQVNYLGNLQKDLFTNVNDEGEFVFQFQSTIPIDYWVVYRPQLLAYAEPGDSVYIELWHNDSVQFHGDNSQFNQFIYRFRKDWAQKFFDYQMLQDTLLVMEQEGYIDLLDSLKLASDVFLTSYLSENEIINPTEVSWIQGYTDGSYYDMLFYFIMFNRNKPSELIRDKIIARLPLNPLETNNSYAANSFTNYFMHSILIRPLFELGPVQDTLILKTLLNYDEDTLLRQLMLAENLGNKLRQMDPDNYTQYKNEIDSILHGSHLEQILSDRYHTVLRQIEKPDPIAGHLIEDSTFHASNLMDSILSANKGKVVYIDVWATWCSPCISEFETQSPFKEELASEPITFVYLCGASQKVAAWQAMVSKYNLEGINIWLNKKQTKQFDSAYQIEGYPTYYIYNSRGELAEKGFQWRPSMPQTLDRINELISQIESDD